MSEGEAGQGSESAPQKPQKKIVAGFWLRWVAGSLDATLLGGLGYFLGKSTLASVFYDMGSAAVLVGLGITFVYFGVLETSIGNGQSIGKKILNIQVLKIDGTHMALPTSLGRYAVFALAVIYGTTIWEQLIAFFPNLDDDSAMTYAASLVWIYLLLSVSLLVAFHPQKRGIHDLIAGTVVVRINRFDNENVAALYNPQKATRAYSAVAVISLIAIGGYWALFGRSEDRLEDTAEDSVSYISRDQALAIEAVERLIEQETIFDDVSIIPMTARTVFGAAVDERVVQFKLISVSARINFYKANEFDILSSSQETVTKIVNNLDDIGDYKCIEVALDGGIDIGMILSFGWVEYLEFDNAGSRIEDYENLLRIPPPVADVPGCHFDKASVAGSTGTVPELSSWSVRALIPED